MSLAISWLGLSTFRQLKLLQRECKRLTEKHYIYNYDTFTTSGNSMLCSILHTSILF